ncbi:MAG: retropepsin-like aspartic protease [Pseudomonadota bacterium]
MPIQTKLAIAGAALSLSLTVLSSPLNADAEDKLGPLLIDAGYTEIEISKLPTGHEIVQVSLNGETGLFVVDSGAGTTVVHYENAEKYGLAIADSEQTGTGAGGQLAVSQAAIDGITMGDTSLSMETVHVMDLSHVVDALAAATATEIDGVVGQDILTRFGGIIDVRGGRLFLQVVSED